MTAPKGNALTGTANADTLTGTDGTDIIEGLGGDDVLDGGKGEDVASYISAPAAVVVNLGSFGGFAGFGQADGGAGHDILQNFEDVFGSAFNDTLTGDNDLGNYLGGLGGNDTLDGGGGDDRLYGGNGNDSVVGGAGNDYLEGGAGDDTLDGSAGTDTVGFTGKLGDYTVSFDSASGAYTITDKTAGRDGSDRVSNVESFTFSDTTVSGTQLLAAANDKTPPTLVNTTPGSGAVGVSVSADILITFSEAIALGSGSIVLKDALGNVVATYSASNTANLSVSGSTLTIHFTNPLAASTGYSLELGTNSVKDLAGNPFANYSGYTFTTAGSGGTQTATASNPNLTGTTSDDTLIAGPGNGTLDGGAGNDVLKGGTGHTTMLGGAGNDTLISGSGGGDTMQGGDGADLYYVNSPGDQVIETASNAAQPLDPNAPHDADLGRAVDKVIASINYTLTAFVENLSLASASGNLAGNGNDLNNELYGNEGSNVLNGKAGNDTIDGGTGVDTAQYSGKLSDYKVTLGAGANASTVADNRAAALSEGTDSLTNVERLQFSDGRLALDMGANQAGGKTVLMMAVATSLGPLFVTSQPYAGLFLGFFDSGASLLDGATLLVSSGIVAAFAGGSDNASLVKMVYNNVYGKAPDAATLAALVAPLNAGTLSPAQWMADMAASTVNQQHVNLAGYAGTGLQYTV